MKTFILTIAFVAATTTYLLSQGTNWSLKLGKYSCTASKYINGAYEFKPRGSFILTKENTYSYNGFEKPSKGTYSIDKSGNVLFKGGYFDGGKAEKTDRTNKLLLVFPSNPDNRWTVTLVE